MSDVVASLDRVAEAKRAGRSLAEDERARRIASWGAPATRPGTVDLAARVAEHPAIVAAGRSGFLDATKVELLSKEETAARLRTNVDGTGLVPQWGASVEAMTTTKPFPFTEDVLTWIRVLPTTTSVIATAVEGSRTEVAASQVFGVAAQQSNISFTQVAQDPEWFAVWMAVARSVLADKGTAAEVVSLLLDRDLRRQVLAQVLDGDGTGSNFTGILNTPGIGTQALGTDAPTVAISKAAQTVREANHGQSGLGLAIHPTDAGELSREVDANGLPVLSDTIESWSLLGLTKVTLTTLVPQGTAIVGDFSTSTLYVSSPVTLSASDAHANFFTQGLAAVLADTRCEFHSPYGAAYVAVTGL